MWNPNFQPAPLRVGEVLAAVKPVNHASRRELLSTQERLAPMLFPPGFSLLGSLYPSHVQSAQPEWLKVSSLEVPPPGGDAPATHLSEAGPCFSSASVPQHQTAQPGHPQREGCVCVLCLTAQIAESLWLLVKRSACFTMLSFALLSSLYR